MLEHIFMQNKHTGLVGQVKTSYLQITRSITPASPLPALPELRFGDTHWSFFHPQMPTRTPYPRKRYLAKNSGVLSLLTLLNRHQMTPLTSSDVASVWGQQAGLVMVSHFRHSNSRIV